MKWVHSARHCKARSKGDADQADFGAPKVSGSKWKTMAFEENKVFTLQQELACAGLLSSRVGGEREWQLLTFSLLAEEQNTEKECHDTDRHKSFSKSARLTLQGLSVKVLAYRSESQRQ